MVDENAKQPEWYGKEQSNGHGLVIDEQTGRTVAVAYDVRDVHVLAAALRMKAVLEFGLLCFDSYGKGTGTTPDWEREFKRAAREALAYAAD